MQIIDQGIAVHSQANTDRQSSAFPGICVTPSGRWLVTYRAASTKAGLADQAALLCWSDDAGQTWSEPDSPFDPPHYGDMPGRFRTAYLTALDDGSLLAALSWVDDSDSKRPFFNEETEGLLDTRICLSRSTDDGLSWSASTFVDTSPLDVPVPLTGPILNLGSSKVLAIQLELNKNYLDNEPWHHRSMLLLSHDRGLTWPEHIVTSDDPTRRIFYWDQRAAVVGDGELLDLFWTFDRAAGEYLNIHARRSTNCGLDWSPMWDTGVPGQPAQPVRLADGRLAMVYVDRTDSPVIKLRTSDDQGRQLPPDTELTLFAQHDERGFSHPGDMQTAWDEMYDFALGLPATALLPDGDLLVVFYAGQSGDKTSIHWVRLHP